MIKSITVSTFELDDIDIAVSQITDKLKPINPNENMIGIIACSYDYIEMGVVEELAKALPFDIIGQTSISQAVEGEAGMLMLSLMVLYSDDCKFAGGKTGSIPDTGDMSAVIAESYNETAKKLGEPVKLVIAFPPLMNGQSGDGYVSAFSALSGHAPVFGSICSDDSPGYANARTIYNSESYGNKVTYILVSGNVSPEFKIVSVSGKSRLPYKGEITASQGNLLMGINDMSALDYMSTIGLTENGKIRSGISSIPFLISFDDEFGYKGEAVARALFAITPENYAVCGGEMPVGASITVGICDKKDVLETTRDTLKEICADYPNRTVLMFSCIGRRLALGTEPLLEVEMAKREMCGESFMLGYSSGEICPAGSASAGIANRFHNYTLVACIL